MGQMKTIAIDFAEFEEEILTLLNMVRDCIPESFALIFDDDLTTESIEILLSHFTIDKELIALTVCAIEMDIVDFVNFTDEETVLSLKIPFLV